MDRQLLFQSSFVQRGCWGLDHIYPANALEGLHKLALPDRHMSFILRR